MILLCTILTFFSILSLWAISSGTIEALEEKNSDKITIIVIIFGWISEVFMILAIVILWFNALRGI